MVKLRVGGLPKDVVNLIEHDQRVRHGRRSESWTYSAFDIALREDLRSSVGQDSILVSSKATAVEACNGDVSEVPNTVGAQRTLTLAVRGQREGLTLGAHESVRVDHIDFVCIKLAPCAPDARWTAHTKFEVGLVDAQGTRGIVVAVHRG